MLTSVSNREVENELNKDIQNCNIDVLSIDYKLIDNSKIVIKTYPDSKYVDDAIYIIAKASFLRDEIAIAESQSKLLLRQYPDSKFYSYSEIWLAYSHFRMGLVDSAQSEINIL